MDVKEAQAAYEEAQAAEDAAIHARTLAYKALLKAHLKALELKIGDVVVLRRYRASIRCEPTRRRAVVTGIDVHPFDKQVILHVKPYLNDGVTLSCRSVDAHSYGGWDRIEA